MKRSLFLLLALLLSASNSFAQDSLSVDMLADIMCKCVLPASEDEDFDETKLDECVSDKAGISTEFMQLSFSQFPIDRLPL